MTFDEWIKQAIFTQQVRTQEEWMRIAFDAATTIEREDCAMLCDEKAGLRREYGFWQEAEAASELAEDIRKRSNVVVSVRPRAWQMNKET